MRNDTSEQPPASPVHAPARRILRNGATNMLSQCVYAALNIVVVIALARGAGKEVLGGYYILFAVLTVVQLIFEAGMSILLTCRIAQAGEGWKKLAAEAMGLFGLLALASLGLFLAAGAAWAAIAGDSQVLLACAAAGLACAALQVERFCTGIFRAFDSFHVENLGRIIQPTIFATLTVVLVWQNAASVASVMAVLATSHLLTATGMLVALHRKWGCLSWRPWPVPVLDWLRQSVPLGAGDVLRGLTFELDTLILGLARPPAAVGVYTVAYRPIGPLGWVSRGLLTAAFPSFARLAVQDLAALNAAASRSTRLLWVAGLPLAVIVCLCAESIIVLLFGPTYSDAVPLLQILVWLVPLSFLATQLRYFFTAIGAQRTFVRLVVFGLIFKAVALAVLIPIWGYTGACVGSLVAEGAFAVTGLLLCRRLGVAKAEWGTMGRALVAAGVMAGLLYFALNTSIPMLVTGVILSVGAYVALCLLFGAIRREELVHLRNALPCLAPQPAVTVKCAENSPVEADDDDGSPPKLRTDLIRAAVQRMDRLRRGSITSPPSLSRLALEQALGEPVNSHSLWHLTWNRIYRVRTASDRIVVAKQGATQTDPELVQEYEHLAALSRLSIPGLQVPRPLGMIPAERAYLADLVPGRSVVSLLDQDSDEELEQACVSAGRVLARIHTAWIDDEQPVPVEALSHDLAEMPGGYSRQEWDTVNRALEWVAARRVAVGQAYLDFNPRNVLCDGDAVALVDPPRERFRSLLLWDYATFHIELRREWWKRSTSQPWRRRSEMVQAGLSAFAYGYADGGADRLSNWHLPLLIRLLQLQRTGQMMTERLAELWLSLQASSPIPRAASRTRSFGTALASLALLKAQKRWLLRHMSAELAEIGRVLVGPIRSCIRVPGGLTAAAGA